MDAVALLERKWNGRVRVTLQGLGMQRVLAVLHEMGIEIEDMVRLNYMTLAITIRPRDIPKLEDALGEMAITIEKGQATGWLGLLKRLGRRYALWVPLAVGALLVGLYATRIWRVEITGCYQIPQVAIEDMIKSYGFRLGMEKGGIDVREWQRRLMMEFPILQWVGLHTDGVKLVVQVKENDPPIGMARKQEGDIVAVMDGIVEEITVLRGVAMVKPGDRVVAGQVLIRGVITWPENGEKPVAAEGSVKGRIFREAVVSAPIVAEREVETGQRAVRRVLKIGSLAFPIDGQNPFDRYTETTHFKPLGGAYSVFPIGVETTEYRQTATTTEQVDRESMEKQLVYQAERQAMAALPERADFTDRRHVCDVVGEETMVVSLWVEAVCELAGRPGPGQEAPENTPEAQ
nr:sporulation protein YqfD [bacterium]